MAAAVRTSAETGAERRLRYQQVYDRVLELIDEGGLTGGDRLPSSTELARLTGVSLISVRRALDELERAGRVVRHQGVGTFVAPERILTNPTRTGELLETLVEGSPARPLTTRLLRITVGTPSENILRALSIDEGQPVWEVTRLRNIGTSPAILEQAVLPLALVPALDEVDLAAGGSLYRFLEQRYGLRDDYVEQALEVDQPTPAERESLQLLGRQLVVRVRGVSFDGAGVAFDCYQQTYRARDFVFYTAGTNSDRRWLQLDRRGAWDVRPLAAGAGAASVSKGHQAVSQASRTGPDKLLRNGTSATSRPSKPPPKKATRTPR
ncbi:MAG: GntR family transcriptional regulator [Candidatus Nanopelagicales bacterium]